MENTVDLITYAIPFFFLLMGVELVVGRARGVRGLYRGPDVVADLALGTLQVIFTVVAAGILSWLYLSVYEHRLFTLDDSNALVWVGAFLGVDFCYYWFHRASHRSMLAWATHAPHHSSEDYNFAVALRQGPVQPLASRFFYLPLAFVGVSFPMFVVLASINTLYQFWIHTQLINRLGPLEWILNTPSHHRVHHGCNGDYLDKNHGGILIIWDRLFGSFVPERAPPVFGTVKPAGTWNPLIAAWLPFKDMLEKISASSSPVDVLRAVFGPPEWLPAGMAAAPPVTGARDRFDDRVGVLATRYVGVMLVVVLLLSVVYIVGAPKLGVATSVVVAGWLTWSYGSLGAILDASRFARASEVMRHLALAPLVAWLVLGIP